MSTDRGFVKPALVDFLCGVIIGCVLLLVLFRFAVYRRLPVAPGDPYLRM